jgi:hypothetical protein
MHYLTMICRIGFVLTLAVSVVCVCSADESDLSNGVLITHHVPEIEYTPGGPSEGWCEYYLDNYAIYCCDHQNTRIDIGPEAPSVWYILAAWEEEKEFCGVDFGFDTYDASDYGFADWGPCCALFIECLEISTAGWPGPNEGTAVATMEAGIWAGNFVPIYWFAGYAYGAAVIPLGVDPPTGDAVFGNCLDYPEIFDITCLGAMGIFTDGIACCPQGGPSPTETSTWGGIKQLYR